MNDSPTPPTDEVKPRPSGTLLAFPGAADSDPYGTAERIRAFVDSMEVMSGSEFTGEIKAQMNRGRRAMERLAISARGQDAPALKLTPDEIADVLTWLSCCEPAEPATWWVEGIEDVSHVCGYMFVLEAMADSLRESRPGNAPETRP